MVSPPIQTSSSTIPRTHTSSRSIVTQHRSVLLISVRIRIYDDERHFDFYIYTR